MRITLTVTEGPHQGKSFTFEEHDNFIVGRSLRAHFQLAVKDKYFSRYHFLVEVNPPQCRLLDLNSRNGTYVNGVRTATVDLKDGDLVKAGRTVLRVEVTADRDAGPTQLAPPVTVVQAAPAPSAPAPPLVAPGGGARVPNALCPVCELGETAGGELCIGCREQVRRHPQAIPGYQIVRPLGKGAMGVVYLAFREADASVVAVKTISPAASATPGQVARFLREANLLKELQHPNIVTFRDMGEANGQLYFAMDYVRGSDAGQHLKARGPLPVARAVRLLRQALKGVAHAHAQGIVHRDIKPSNLLLGQDEERQVVKVADFGLARLYQASQLSGLTMTGDIGGTPYYMPPEQITNYREARPPADQYAAAATLYHLLTGQHLFDYKGPGKVRHLLVMILDEEPVQIQARRHDIPDGLAAAIHRALAKDPAKRFADVDAFSAALLPYA
jgi:serine/threonine-protein kinase